MIIETDRRTQILNAALACFLAQGYRATSIADIRAASGASTGSLYHFFENKAAIARALLDRAVTGWSGAAVATQNANVSAERAILATISGFVGWGLENLALVRFMDEIRTIADTDPDFATIRVMLAEGRRIGEERYRLFERRGEVRPMAFSIAHSLMLGPAYNYLRLVASGHPPDPNAPAILAEAGWSAVRT